jgi:hypothetical protein
LDNAALGPLTNLAENEVPGAVGEFHLNASADLHHLQPGYVTSGGQRLESTLKVFAGVGRKLLFYLLSRAFGIG